MAGAFESFSMARREIVRRRASVAVVLVVACAWASGLSAVAAPIPIAPGILESIGSTPSPFSPQSIFGVRWVEGRTFVASISQGGLGRTDVCGLPLVHTVQAVTSPADVRVLMPFRGDHSESYILVGGGNANNYFRRYAFDLTDPVAIESPFGTTMSDGWDWVNDNTIIFPGYASGMRNRLYLMDVAADPFALSVNTQWNPDGYAETSAARIRHVRAGKTYTNYAYYGESNNNVDPGLYALDLTTGAETKLGELGGLTGTGSFGVFTVMEAGGYLFVQTTDNGIFVYNMEDATTLGASLSGDPLVPYYSKALLNSVTGVTGSNYSFDVSPDLTRILLPYGGNAVFHLVPEPSTAALLGLAIAALSVTRTGRRRRRIPRPSRR